jgi:hypothetical protein
MLEQAERDRIIDRAAASILKAARPSKVFSEPVEAFDGAEALRVTIVLRTETVDNVTGDQALDTLVLIYKDLQESGEERFPILEFVGEDELELDDDPQS